MKPRRPFRPAKARLARPKPAGASASTEAAAAAPGERLQKVLAAAGLGSRRECEEYILAGRVEVDGKTVTELGTRVEPGVQQIRVDGQPIAQPRRVYYALNKPPGILSTNNDPSGRPRAIDLVPGDERLFTVGRLDMHSEGLILLTNDGELADRLTHPRYGVEKIYLVQVLGQPSQEILQKLVKGVRLAEGFVRAKRVSVRKQHKHGTQLEMVLAEGKNREIRRMLASLGHRVQRLVRVAVGPVRLGDLPLGAHRPLDRKEIAALRAAASGETASRERRPRKFSKPKQFAPRRAEQPRTRTVIGGEKAPAGHDRAKPPRDDRRKKFRAGSKKDSRR
jgi:23S rRNA pseudouridine2605 synthase